MTASLGGSVTLGCRNTYNNYSAPHLCKVEGHHCVPLHTEEYITTKSTTGKGRFLLSYSRKEKLLNMTIHQLAEEDTAVYHCNVNDEQSVIKQVIGKHLSKIGLYLYTLKSERQKKKVENFTCSLQGTADAGLETKLHIICNAARNSSHIKCCYVKLVLYLIDGLFVIFISFTVLHVIPVTGYEREAIKVRGSKQQVLLSKCKSECKTEIIGCRF